MRPELSIIIVNWNTKDCLQDCLRSIYEKIPMDVTYEIIVVDNASTDGSKEMVNREFPLVKLIVNNKNVGFGRACNQSAKEVKGRYLLILNPDIEIKEVDFKKLFNIFEKKHEIGAIIPIVFNSDGSPTYTSKRIILNPIEAFNYIYRYRRWQLPIHKVIRSLSFTEVQEQDYPPGFCFLIPAKIFRGLNGFDENFFLYFEDTDIGIRLTQHCYKTVSYPGFRVIHGGGKATSQDINVKDLSLHKSAVYFFRKVYGNRRYILIKLLLMIGAVLEIIYIFVKYFLRRISIKDFRKLFIGQLKILKWHILNPVVTKKAANQKGRYVR